ncbi:MAG: nucleotide pyrophosphohydrolase [Candidatus Jacksonbacteria bacterium]
MSNDQTATIRQLRELVNKFRKERDWNKATPAMFAKDIAVEAGELLDHFVWDENAYLKDADIAKEIKYELVDVLYAVLMMSEALKVDLTITLKKKLTILAKKYPAEQCRQHKGDISWVWKQRKKFRNKK